MITPRRDSILGYLERYIAEHGYSPSIREIAQFCDVKSLSSIAHHLRALNYAGLIHWETGRSRTIRLTKAGPTN